MPSPDEGARRDKLLSLRRREDMKDALTEELKAQYSACVPSHRIEREVQSFIKTARLSERNLQKLERRLDRFAASADDSVSVVSATPSMMSGISAYSARTSVTGLSRISAYSNNDPEAKSGNYLNSTNLPKAPPAYGGSERLCTAQSGRSVGIVGKQLAPVQELREDPPKEETIKSPPLVAEESLEGEDATPDKCALEFEWAELDKHAAALLERDAAQAKERTSVTQFQLRSDLDQQVADSRLRKAKARENDRRYFMNQLGEIDKWKEAERNRMGQMKERHDQEKMERDAQLQYNGSLKQAENSQHQAEDQALLQQISQDLEAERKLQDSKRRNIREGMKKTWTNTLQELENKKEQHKQEQKEELEALTSYLTDFDANEQRKKDVTRNRLDAHSAFLSTLKCQSIEDEKQRDALDAERAAREQFAMDTRQREMHQSRRDKLKGDRLETQDVLFEQMREKEESKLKAGDEKRMQALFLAQDTEDYYATEKAKDSARRAKNLEHRRELEAQISENKKPYPGLAVAKRGHSNRSEALMTETELKYNTRLVADVRSGRALTAR